MIQFHSICLTSVILHDDDEDYTEDGDTGMCGNCKRRWKTARSRAVEIITRHEARLDTENQDRNQRRRR